MNIDWAMRRRLIITAVVVGFLGVVSTVYLLTHKPLPTCFDGVQNQNEEAVDCGGVCSLQCTNNRVNPDVKWTKLFPVRAGIYDVAALVEYPSGGTGVPELSYTATVYGEGDAVLATRTGTTFVGPSDHFLVFAGGISVSATPTRASLAIDQSFKVVRSSSTPPSLSVVNRDLSSPDAHPHLRSLITNGSSVALRNVPVAAIISDASGPVAVAETFIESLPAHSSRMAEFTWPEALKYQNTEACSVPVDAMLVLDRSGSMKDDGKLEGAKAAAGDFVRSLAGRDQIGFASFATHVSNPIDQFLTLDKASVSSKIASTSILKNGLQYTNMMEGLDAARAELSSSRARPEASKAVVFLTDGEPTDPRNPNDRNDKVYPAQKALDMATEIKNLGIHIYAIGLGKEAIDYADFLKALASDPTDFYPADKASDLSGIYKEIGTSICKRGPSVIEIIPRVDAFGSTDAPR